MPEKKRWVMLFLYCFLQWAGGSIWITFASITKKSESYYSIHATILNLFSLSFLIMQFPMAPLSSVLFRRSYYWTMMLAFVISVIGVWVRVLAGRNVAIALLGQTLVGAMNSMTLPGCAVLAKVWFEEKERPIAVAIASTSSLLGAAYGLVIASYFPSIQDLLLSQAAYMTLSGILNVILSRNIKVITEESTNFKLELRLAIKDKYLLIIIILVSSALGVAYAITGIIYQILEPYDITEKQSGWIGFSMYIGGTIGGLLTSIVVIKTKNFVNPIRIFAGLSIFGIGFWSILADFPIADVIGAGFCGLGLYGIMPLGIQAVVDQNRHVPESITTNMIYLIAQALSVVYTYPMVYFDSFAMVSGIWLGAGLCTLSFIILVIIYRESLIEKYREINESVAVSMKSVLNPYIN